MADEVLYERRGPVALITLNRPQYANAQNSAMTYALDAAGYLTITGRLKDMYICGGFNVYPAEVEQVLARLDGVAEAAVIGVADPRLGEVGQAFVVARPGFVLAEEDVLAFCRERLAGYKVPRRVEFRDALPRNPSGKVLKRALRKEP